MTRAAPIEPAIPVSCHSGIACSTFRKPGDVGGRVARGDKPVAAQGGYRSSKAPPHPPTLTTPALFVELRPEAIHPAAAAARSCQSYTTRMERQPPAQVQAWSRCHRLPG